LAWTNNEQCFQGKQIFIAQIPPLQISDHLQSFSAVNILAWN